MYESLRQLILASQSSDADAVFSAMDLAFAIDLCKEEGGGQVKRNFLILAREFWLVCLLMLYRNNLDGDRTRDTNIWRKNTGDIWTGREREMES